MSHPLAPPQILRLLFWESTIRCNLSCAHCRRIEGDDTAGTDLSTETALDLIDQLAALGRSQEFMPRLVFSGGEPLCRDDIFDLIGAAAGKDIKCALATNGTLVDAAAAERIRAAGVERVSVSLDGATSAVHNQLRRQDGSFEAALGGIGCLRAAGVPFQINMTLTRHNAHQLDAVFELAEQLGAAAIHFFMLVPVGCGGEFDPSDLLSAADYEKQLLAVAQKQQTAKLEIKVTCAPHYERILHQHKLKKGHPSKGCLAGLGVLFVSHRGQVFPCGYLPVECGHILTAPLAQIWKTSPDLARMRDADQLEGKCGVCGYRYVCGGCRARALAATGSYMQSEPMCVYEPPTKGPQ